MDLGLRDRVTLIGGGSRGIGLGIAKVFLEEGARVAIVARGEGRLREAASALSEAFGDDYVMGFAADLSDRQQVKRVLEAVVAEWSRLDVVIANAGAGTDASGWDVPSDSFEEALRANFWASQILAQTSVGHLAEWKGVIVFTGSIAGYECLGAPAPYETAKAALHAYAKSLSRTVAPLGIRVNTVVPGNVVFPGGRWAERLEKEREATEGMLRREVPLGRFGRTEEIGAAVAFLASSQASFITGACLVVDGGQTRSF